jgi:hypothetical protein
MGSVGSFDDGYLDALSAAAPAYCRNLLDTKRLRDLRVTPHCGQVLAAMDLVIVARDHVIDATVAAL